MERRRQGRRVPVWAYLLLSVVLVVLIFYIIARVQVPVDGAGSVSENGQYVITTILEGGPADIAGLCDGDIITKIGNQPVGEYGHFALVNNYRAGDSAEYLIIRDGTELKFHLTFHSLWSLNPSLYLGLYVLILIVCTTSLLIIIKRPYDNAAKIFFIYLQLFAIAQNFRFLYLDEIYALVASVAFIFSFNLVGIVLLQFHLNFPQPLWDQRRMKPPLKFAYALGISFGGILATLMVLRNLDLLSDTYELFAIFSTWSYRFMAFILVLTFAVAIVQYKRSEEIQRRKQLQLVLAGSFFGLLVPVFFGIFSEYFYYLGRKYYLVSTLEFLNAGGTYIMTSFLAVAIFRYRLWNVELFIRKATLYGTATIVIYLTYSILIYTVELFIKERTGAIHFTILAASIFTFLFLLDHLQRSIDRLFYRESYDTGRILDDFEKKVAEIFKRKDFVQEVIGYMENIFHFRNCILVLKRGQNLYEPVYTYGSENDISQKPFILGHDLENKLVLGNIISIEEIDDKHDIIEKSDGVVIVPLVGEQMVQGFLVLGPKLSYKSYSLQDIKVLSFFARRLLTLLYSARLYRENLEQFEILERERTRIARDIHDDLGANLTRISILSDIVKSNMSDPEKAASWLDQIADNCRAVTRDMTQIVWALNPKNDTLGGLMAYIRRFAIEFLEITNIKCVFVQPEDIPYIKIGVEMRRNIYLILREALNNIVKHSSAANAWITLDLSKNKMDLTVRDDGIGFDACKLKDPGNGLINMKKRSGTLGGKVFIRSGKGKGTIISILIPMNKEIFIDDHDKRKEEKNLQVK